jgi:hypothetical protein
MLFGNSRADFESEKERNLYYKIFAGYFFNELIPGYEDRLKQFCHLLDNASARGESCSPKLISLDPKSTHVSFDNHLYLFKELETDRGEFADIVIHDISASTIIAIEAKLHSNWSYDKDIVSNQARHAQLNSIVPATAIIPVLLVTRFRWERAKAKESSEHSNYLRFLQDPNCSFRVVLWEEIAGLILEERVREFLEAQLARYDRGSSYARSGKWFVQQPPKTTKA